LTSSFLSLHYSFFILSLALSVNGAAALGPRKSLPTGLLGFFDVNKKILFCLRLTSLQGTTKARIPSLINWILSPKGRNDCGASALVFRVPDCWKSHKVSELRAFKRGSFLSTNLMWICPPSLPQTKAIPELIMEIETPKSDFEE
jgi:hypothetical protein